MIVTVTLNPSLDEWVYLPALRLGDLNRAIRFVRYPGGKGINVARVIHELGQRTLAVALAGGSDGKILSHLLTTQYQIPHRFVTVAGSTRNNYQIQTGSPRTITQINCPGPVVSRTSLHELTRILRHLGHRASCVVLSGSLPPGAPTTTYRRVLTMLRPLQVPTVLDTSGPALRDGLLARPWLIKPNRQEVEELLGRRLRGIAQVAQAAKHLVKRGPSVVIVSLGPEGAVLASQGQAQVLWAKPPRVPVDSPVGAGDSLIAGFVVGYQATRVLPEALRLGVACGAACALTPGTELCYRKDVRRLVDRVRLRVLP